MFPSSGGQDDKARIKSMSRRANKAIDIPLALCYKPRKMSAGIIMGGLIQSNERRIT
jgi:hypothetical protein